MSPLPQAGAPTVGDTIWVTRIVDLPVGRTLRPAEMQAADPIEPLGTARVTIRGESAEVAYPVAIWRPGTHTVRVPGPLLLAPDGTVDSLATEAITLRVASVLPRVPSDSVLRPQPRADYVPRPVTSPAPLLILLLLATALLLPLHWWWRRRGRPRPPSTAHPGGPPRPPLERWADAGEARAVAAVAAARLRSALAAALPDAVPSLDTAAVLARVAEHRPEWPVVRLGDLLRQLDEARFGYGAGSDAIILARRAAEIERELGKEAA